MSFNELGSTAEMSFSDLGLSDDIMRAVGKQGYTVPTLIQSKAIPVIMQGSDVMAGAQTGTGKTAGFTLPLLHRLGEPNEEKGTRPIRALILTPTRELAAQVGASVNTYGSYTSLRCAVIFGGVKIFTQIKKLRKGVDILVATPGRLLDHVSQGTVDLSKVEIFVLDEADRMLDMGFIPDIRKIEKLMPKSAVRQSLLFSATFSNEIKKLANSLLKKHTLIEVERQKSTTNLIKQVVYPVDKSRKGELVSHLIGSQNWHQVLVFSRTKHGADKLVTRLEKDGLHAAAFHGNKNQGARTRILEKFKKGEVRVLVATDIAARGLDIDKLPHVINFDLPNNPEDYVHRIGRTGRANTKGDAISLVSVDETKLLRDIEKFVEYKIDKEVLEGYEVDPSIKAEPGRSGRKKRSSGKSNSSWQGVKKEGSRRDKSAKAGRQKFESRGDKEFNPKHRKSDSRDDDFNPRRRNSGSRDEDFNSRRRNNSSRDEGFNSQRRNSGSRDEDFNSRRRNSGSRDEDFNSRRRNSGSRDEDFNSRRRNSGSRDEGFNSKRRSSGSRDEDFNSRRRNSGSRDDGFNSQRRNSNSRDDGFNSRRRNSGSRDEGFNSRRRNSGSRDEGFNSQRRNSGSRDEGFNSQRRNSGSRDEGFNSQRRNSGSRDDGFNSKRRSSGSRDGSFNSDRKRSGPRRDENSAHGRNKSASRRDDDASSGRKRKSSRRDDQPSSWANKSGPARTNSSAKKDGGKKKVARSTKRSRGQRSQQK